MLQSKMAIAAAIAAGLMVFGQPAVAAEDCCKAMAMAAQANTKSQHEAAAVVHEKEAATLREKAATHKKDASTYRTGGGGKSAAGQLSEHCDKLAQKYSDAATEHDAIAKLHRDLAAPAK
jgi:hypothetical protein